MHVHRQSSRACEALPQTQAIATTSNGDDGNEETGASEKTVPTASTTENSIETWKPTWRFATVIVALSTSGLVTSLENTITGTALPTIVDDLGGADLYIWAVNAYTLTMTASQPLYGQVADVFGRFYPILVALSFFSCGSGVCGGATSMAMLIAGRALQGIGAGGVTCLAEIIICDLVPLRQRGQWIGIMFSIITLGTAAGPVFGGLLISYVSWRWTFYMSLPIGGFSMLMIMLFVRLKHNRQGNLLEQVRRIDWTGNIILIASVIAVLIPLSQATIQYPWSSWRILVPLLIGLLIGMPLFLFYESSSWCREPTLPLRLLHHRTTLVALAITFLHAICTLWVIYFMPVYFQSVKQASPVRSGVMLLPTIILMLPFVMVGGKLMEVTGRFKPVHLSGLAIMLVGFGLLSLLDRNSSTALWVIFQIIEVAGIGMLVGALLPAVQAPLADSDTALSASVWSFLRCFGMIWGVAIPSSIFNNRSELLANRLIENTEVRETLRHGRAYEHATKSYLESLPSDKIRDQVITVFERSMSEVWLVAIAFAALAFLLTFVEKEVKLRDKVDTEYGMQSKKESEAEKLSK